VTQNFIANQTRWLSFRNDSGETIPSYGVFSIPLDTEVPTTDVDKLRLIAKKYDPQDPGDDPNTYLAFGGRYERVMAINGKSPVEAGRWGRCTFAYDGPAWARWKPEADSAIEQDRMDSTLINTQNVYPVQVGPHPGTFGMSAYGFGFRVLRTPLSSDERVLVQQIPPEVPFQVEVTSPWLSAYTQGGQRGSSASPSSPPYAWCIGQPLNGLQSLVTPSTPTAGTPRHKACIAILCTGPNSDIGLIMDGGVITVQYHRGAFYAISGGSHYVANCYVEQGASAGSNAIVDLSYSLDDPVGPSSNYQAECLASDPRFAIPTGTFADVQYSVADRVLYVTGVHCP